MKNFLQTIANNMASKKKLVSAVAVVVVAVAFAIVQKPVEDENVEQVYEGYTSDVDA